MGDGSEMLCAGAVLMLISMILLEQFSWPSQALAAAGRANPIIFRPLGVRSVYAPLRATASRALAKDYVLAYPQIELISGVALAGDTVHPKGMHRL